jgi:hypothetical protein
MTVDFRLGEMLEVRHLRLQVEHRDPHGQICGTACITPGKGNANMELNDILAQAAATDAELSKRIRLEGDCVAVS